MNLCWYFLKDIQIWCGKLLMPPKLHTRSKHVTLDIWTLAEFIKLFLFTFMNLKCHFWNLRTFSCWTYANTKCGECHESGAGHLRWTAKLRFWVFFLPLTLSPRLLKTLLCIRSRRVNPISLSDCFISPSDFSLLSLSALHFSFLTPPPVRPSHILIQFCRSLPLLSVVERLYCSNQ